MKIYPFNKILYTNKILFNTINNILDTVDIGDVDIKDIHLKGMNIGELLMSVSDGETLEKSMDVIDKRGFFMVDNEHINMVDEIVVKAVAEGVDGVRVKSICYGILLKHAAYNGYFNRKKKKDVPSPRIVVYKNYVKHNLDEIINEINRGTMRGIKDQIKKYPVDEQAQKYKVAISTMAEISIDYDTDEFDRDMERLKIMKENIVGENISDSPTAARTKTIPEVPEVETNPYPRMFTCTNAWKLFKDWAEAKKNKNTNIADFSFIYGKMQEDRIIFRGVKPAEYKKFVNGLPNYGIDIEQVKQLWNCSSSTNIDLYNTLKGIYEPYEIEN